MNKIKFKDIKVDRIYHINYEIDRFKKKMAFILVREKNLTNNTINGIGIELRWTEWVTQDTNKLTPIFDTYFELSLSGEYLKSIVEIKDNDLPKVFNKICELSKRMQTEYKRQIDQYENREIQYLKTIGDLDKPFWKRMFRK